MKVKVWARVGLTIIVDIDDPNDEAELAEKAAAKLTEKIISHEDLKLNGESYIPEEQAISLETGIYVDDMIPACLDGPIQIFY